MTANVHLRLHIETRSVFNITDIFTGKIVIQWKKEFWGNKLYLLNFSFYNTGRSAGVDKRIKWPTCHENVHEGQKDNRNGHESAESDISHGVKAVNIRCCYGTRAREEQSLRS